MIECFILVWYNLWVGVLKLNSELEIRVFKKFSNRSKTNSGSVGTRMLGLPAIASGFLFIEISSLIAIIR